MRTKIPAFIKSLSMTAALVLGGWSVGSAHDAPGAAQPTPEANYKQLIADNAPELLKAAGLGKLEVSRLRPTTIIQPGDWIACLKGTAGDRTAYFGVFIKAHKIDAVRRSVIIDHCENEQFGPLPRPKLAKKPTDQVASAEAGPCPGGRHRRCARSAGLK
ncbi:MAG: hypothetical protein ACLPKB_26090 [Xanthobacteraceae bacterium]